MNEVPDIFNGTPFWDLPPKFFSRDKENGTFNSSDTDVVEGVIFLVAASQQSGTSWIPIALGQKWLCCGYFS